jgi:hypothetical protein
VEQCTVYGPCPNHRIEQQLSLLPLLLLLLLLLLMLLPGSLRVPAAPVLQRLQQLMLVAYNDCHKPV